ncbi:hypothetical protein KKC67_01915 [Patescibacteria group bacterium]|nr:hypothetical protein [Patescibacteria group bacterium]
MFKKFLYFIKYNNFAIVILVITIIIGGSVFAAEPAQQVLGQKQTRIEGVDNTALLSADLSNFNMDFKISKIEKDEKFYYVTYTFLDLIIVDNAWQYQLKEKKRKVSQNLSEDLGVYLAGELKEEYDSRLKDLSLEQEKAKQTGVETRVEITDYSGLIGKTLDLAKDVFPNYEPIKKVELPAFVNLNLPDVNSSVPTNSGADNLTQVYDDYIAEHNTDINNATSTNTNIINQENINIATTSATSANIINQESINIATTTTTEVTTH